MYHGPNCNAVFLQNHSILENLSLNRVDFFGEYNLHHKTKYQAERKCTFPLLKLPKSHLAILATATTKVWMQATT